MGARHPAITFALVVLAVTGAGCGYTVRGNLPSHIKTVGVPVFRNRTSQPGVEGVLTQAVVQAFSTNGRLRVVTPSDADAILEGDVVGYELQAIAFDPRGNIQQYRLIVTLNLTFRDVRKNTVLFRQAGVQERSNFQVQGDVANTVSQEREAAQAGAAVDIGRSVVSLAVQRF